MTHGNQGWSTASRRHILGDEMATAVPSMRRLVLWLLADPAMPGPRMWQELILLPFYLLVAFTALQLVVPPLASSGLQPPPAWLDLFAVGVGLLGTLYPSRVLSVAALLAFWLASDITDNRGQYP